MIASGFRGQIDLIRKTLRSKRYSNVVVDGIRSLQGSEYRIVVLSLVRESDSNVIADLRFDIG